MTIAPKRWPRTRLVQDCLNLFRDKARQGSTDPGLLRLRRGSVDPLGAKKTERIYTKLYLVKCLVLVFWISVLAGCALTLRDQPKNAPFQESSFFEDRASARMPVADTVARGQLRLDEHLYSGRVDGRFAQTFPFSVTMDVLERGQERYNIYCTPCHGLAGNGDGIVVEYGMRQPTSFHDPDLRAEPPGYYFDLISRGTRVMPAYGSRIQVEDRWAIVAYIRALQLSQNADLSTVPADEIPNLNQAGP